MKKIIVPQISIIIPCYNNEKHVSIAITSALNQTYQNKQIIVVDDGSTDTSVTVIRNFSDKVQLIQQKNTGASGARNTGIKQASGDYFAFLDSDDYWDHTFLEKMYEKMISEKVKFVYCGWQNVGAHQNKKPFIPPDYELMPNKIELMIESCRWPIHAVLVHKSVIDDVGVFDQKWETSEDFALWMRIAINYKISRVDEVLAFYRHYEGDNLTKDALRVAINHWQVQKEFLKQNRLIEKKIGWQKMRTITYGYLLKKAYEAYWHRDLHTSRCLFRIIMKHFYGSLKDWKYMLPSVLPLPFHKLLLKYFG